MARVTGISFRRDSTQYSLDLSWDEDAFVDGIISIAAEVSVRDLDNDKSEIKTTGTVSLEPVDDGSPILVIKVDDERVFEGPLTEIIGEETVFDHIPRELFLEPITGCLLRAGLSAGIAQILDCKDRTAGIDWVLPRMKVIGRCLADNGMKMAARAAVKAGCCIFAG